MNVAYRLRRNWTILRDLFTQTDVMNETWYELKERLWRHCYMDIRYGHQPWCCDCANLMEHYRDVVWGLEGISDEVKEILAPKVWPLWKWALWRATGVPLPEGPKAIKALVNAIPREALRRALLLFLIVLGNPDGMTGHTLRQAGGKPARNSVQPL